MSWGFRRKEMTRILKSFNPNVISLQYVPYSFDNKGLPLQLFLFLRLLTSDCKWHIMAHELWTMPRHGLIKRLVSCYQKFLTLYIFKLVNPIALHVSNPFYKNLLSDCGISSSILPIFSNIPVIPLLNPTKDDEVWNFVFFGTLSPSWQYSTFLRRVESARSYNSIKLCRFYLIGNCGDFANSLWKHLDYSTDKIYTHFSFKCLGQLSSKKISHFLQLADFGVTSVPLHLLYKSGGVAAMISHNLPVIVTNISLYNPDCFKNFDNLGSYILMDHDFEVNLASSRKSLPQIDRLGLTVNQFISEVC